MAFDGLDSQAPTQIWQGETLWKGAYQTPKNPDPLGLMVDLNPIFRIGLNGLIIGEIPWEIPDS